jgi:uncharacterized iron-regulated membrane protein
MLIREIFKRIHFTLGIVLSIPLAILGITGSILAMTEPAPPAMHARAAAHARSERAPDIDAIVGAAQAAAPAGFRASQYVAGSRSAPARVVFVAPPRAGKAAGQRQYYVDPGTLAVTPRNTANTTSFYASVHALHENLLAGPAGRTVVGWFGVAMLLLGLTGPVAWWPGKRQLREGFTVRRGAGGFRFYRDVHRATGIWAFAFLILLSITGTFIVFPEPIGQTIAAIFPSRHVWNDTVAGMQRAPGAEPMRTAHGVALAISAAGPGRVRSIAFARGNQPLRIELVPEGRPTAGGTIVVLIDPYAQRVLDVRDPQHYSLGENIITMLRPIHEGHIGGWPWHAALFAIGLTPPFFAITGVTMWLFKRRIQHSTKLAPAK